MTIRTVHLEYIGQFFESTQVCIRVESSFVYDYTGSALRVRGRPVFVRASIVSRQGSA